MTREARATTSRMNSSVEANFETTRHSSEQAADAITALLHDRTEHFVQIVSNGSAFDGDVIEELLVALEGIARSDSAQVDAETYLRVVTVVADLASDGLPENEVRRYETPGGTVLQVVTPSSDRLFTGFVLGPFSIPPLGGVQYQNVTVQVIAWAQNFFDLPDVSNTMLTINVRKDKETVELKNLAPPLHFTMDVSERMTRSGTATFDRSCVFWNTTSANWSHHGLQVVHTNLTQVGGHVVLSCADCTFSV